MDNQAGARQAIPDRYPSSAATMACKRPLTSSALFLGLTVLSPVAAGGVGAGGGHPLRRGIFPSGSASERDGKPFRIFKFAPCAKG